MRASDTASGRGRLSVLLHLSSRKSVSKGTTSDSGSQKPPCSPTSFGDIYPSPSFYFSPKHSVSGNSSTSSLRSPSAPSLYMNGPGARSTETVSLTKNELDAKEKAMRLKKARKLSRVFGEIPTVPTHQHQRSSSLASITLRQPDIVSNDVLPQIDEAQLSLIDMFENGITSSLQSAPAPSLGTEHPHRKVMRRSSFDALPPCLDSDIPRRNSRTMKRSRSLHTQKHQTTQESVDFRARYDQNFGEMSLRQKSLNVQRARKMAKLFGQDPPSNLIHISDNDRTATHRKARSAENIDSLPTSPALPVFPRDKPSSSDQQDLADLMREDSTFTPDFRDRRRRADKLSRFFGVAYQNIELVTTPFMPALERGTSNVQVDVKVSRGRFWGFDVERTEEADMNDVIGKLRGLKAS